MKRDLDALEADPPRLPPYITRSTEPRKGHLIDDPNWWAGWNAIVKHEMGALINKQLREMK